MDNAVMGNLDGDLEKVVFGLGEIKQVISRYKANLVSSGEDQSLMLELDGQVFPVKGVLDNDHIMPYFIVLNSGDTLNVSDYQLLFSVQELPKNLISGCDVNSNEHLCRRYSDAKTPEEIKGRNISIEVLDEKIESGDLGYEEMEDLKTMIKKLKEGEFFELLTMEFSGKIKEVAKELIDFRKDIQSKIEPDIVEIASKDIPEASNQLEGINETLESSTMKIMDINDEQMELAQKQFQALALYLSRITGSEKDSSDISLDEAAKVIKNQLETLKSIENGSLKMIEPLSFQDLVGQRIQKTIRLVRSMEHRIEELIVSFGIKLKNHKEDPTKSFDDLHKDVEVYMTELKGPQGAGEGLDQEGIDDLLSNL